MEEIDRIPRAIRLFEALNIPCLSGRGRFSRAPTYLRGRISGSALQLPKAKARAQSLTISGFAHHVQESMWSDKNVPTTRIRPTAV